MRPIIFDFMYRIWYLYNMYLDRDGYFGYGEDDGGDLSPFSYKFKNKLDPEIIKSLPLIESIYKSHKFITTLSAETKNSSLLFEPGLHSMSTLEIVEAYLREKVRKQVVQQEADQVVADSIRDRFNAAFNETAGSCNCTDCRQTRARVVADFRWYLRP